MTKPIDHEKNEAANDDTDETDSSLGDDAVSSAASTSSSILEYRVIHGRTYHAERGDAQYWAANDAKANESLDIRVTVETPPIWGFVGIGLIIATLAGLAWVFRRFGRR